MKAEDRILELLAEYLQKTDRILERMEKTDRNVDTMSKAIADHSIKFIEMNAHYNQKFAESDTKFKEMNQWIIHLSEENGVMLKELLSISRRVSSLEDNK